MKSALIIQALLLLIVASGARRVYRILASPQKSIPGPVLARLTRLWYFFHVRSGSFHHENIELHRRYGPIVRLGPDLYSINIPDKAVYGIGSKFPKSDWYEGWKHPSPDRWGLFADQDIARHATTRKRFQGLYSMSSLLSYEQYVNDCIDIFKQRFAEFERNKDIVNLVHWFQCYAFDVMGNLTYSERFGFLDQGKDIAGMLAALETAGIYSTLVGIYASLHPYLYKLMELIPGSGATGRTYLMNFVQDKIAAREKQRTENGETKPSQKTLDEGVPRDFLDKLRDAHLEDPQKVTKYHMFMMGLSNIIAGSDTTAVSLSSVLFRLITNPLSLETLRNEIADYRKENNFQDSTFPYKIAQQLPYLQAVIKEALRLHPATGLPLWRVVPASGVSIAGHYLPGGVNVGINSWVAHHDLTVYGLDADQFRPQRWLDAEKEGGEHFRRMEAYYIPFGLGSRTCLGRHISILEMCKLIPHLVEEYDFELMMAESQWKTINYWFVKPQRLPVRVKHRVLGPGT